MKSRQSTLTALIWEAMRPFMVPGAYVNYPEAEADPRSCAAYGDNYDRLVTLKNKYDPDNLFRIKPNIRPSG
jgi:hypothetical protein